MIRFLPPRPQGMSNESLCPFYARCGKRHEGRCFACKEGWFIYGESGNMMKDWPNLKFIRREGKQVASISGNVEPQNKNRFYTLQSRKFNSNLLMSLWVCLSCFNKNSRFLVFYDLLCWTLMLFLVFMMFRKVWVGLLPSGA